MLKTRIIPCLDVKDGRVVKGINFIDLIDAGDPAEQAKYYSDSGADEICFLDISASLEKRKTILNIVSKFKKPPIGIRILFYILAFSFSDSDVEDLFSRLIAKFRSEVCSP